MRRLIVLLAAAALSPAAEKPVDFNRDIRPILSDTCFQCHGPDEAKRMAGLRLDTREGAFAVRGKAAVIVAGKPEESRLVARISHEQKALRMPPVASGMTLTDTQVALIRRWIAEGAKWEEHWAFVPPVRPELPAVKNQKWARTPLDRFILARLEREGLKPSREAPKETLIRRVTLDLTGLPPKPADVDAFLKDKSPDAYEKLVDRLLASPHYGERMAMQWLDLARYADTHGYHIDSHRDMWPWRDWVIAAFNRNMPFDQFALWQLAGDLLPDASREQLVATGFNRNHMINFEGGAIPEEYQNEYVVDRVDTTANVFMGLTMGCARCHDHKYDPIRQKDFYRMGAFFNTIAEEGLDGQKGNAKPFLPLPSEKQQADLDRIAAEARPKQHALNEYVTTMMRLKWEEARFADAPKTATEGLTAYYEMDGSLSDISGHFRHARLMKGDLFFGNGPVGRALSLDGNTVVMLPAGALNVAKPFSVAFWMRVGRNQGQPVVHMAGAGGAFEISLGKPKTLPQLKRGHPLEVRMSVGAGRELVLRTPGHEFLQGEAQHVVVTGDGKSTMCLFLNAKAIELKVVRDTLSGAAPPVSDIEIGDVGKGRPFTGTLDDVRFYGRVLAGHEIDRMANHYPVEVLLAMPGKRSREQVRILQDYFLTHEAPADMRESYIALKELEERREKLVAEIPTVMVMEEMDTPRETFLLARGDYTQKKEKVTPGVPSMLPPLPASEPANRLALARWLVSGTHPLTARVTVNRFWQMYFGHGIVKTSEDFGSQGEPPVHPELLDWLATEFVRTGWDVKAIQRLLVTSAVYRQESKVSGPLLEKDPENRLLARGPRQRLPAEVVRDNALAVSGLLVDKIGGPSILPYQPPGLWEELAFGENFSAQEYVQDHGDKLYRRSMYTFWKRTSPPASLSTFDAPDREKCTSRRAGTNTPMQALVTLNDPTYVEASRNLAARVLGDEAARNDDERLKMAFRLVTARAPQRQELAVLRSALQQQKSTYAKDREAARELVAVGESKTTGKTEAGVLAAWTNVCTVLLNMDEAITKE